MKRISKVLITIYENKGMRLVVNIFCIVFIPLFISYISNLQNWNQSIESWRLAQSIDIYQNLIRLDAELSTARLDALNSDFESFLVEFYKEEYGINYEANAKYTEHDYYDYYVKQTEIESYLCVVPIYYENIDSERIDNLKGLKYDIGLDFNYLKSDAQEYCKGLDATQAQPILLKLYNEKLDHNSDFEIGIFELISDMGDELTSKYDLDISTYY